MRAASTMLTIVSGIALAGGAAAQQSLIDDLCAAITSGDVDALGDLLKRGLDPNAVNSVGETA
jgi:hypothetical protein